MSDHTEYVELDDRVFSVSLDPDAPGYCRRTLTIRVESGPGLSLEEYERVSAHVVAELVARGVDVYGWRGVEGPEEGGAS